MALNCLPCVCTIPPKNNLEVTPDTILHVCWRRERSRMWLVGPLGRSNDERFRFWVKLYIPVVNVTSGERRSIHLGSAMPIRTGWNLICIFNDPTECQLWLSCGADCFYHHVTAARHLVTFHRRDEWLSHARESRQNVSRRENCTSRRIHRPYFVCFSLWSFYKSFYFVCFSLWSFYNIFSTFSRTVLFIVKR